MEQIRLFAVANERVIAGYRYIFYEPFALQKFELHCWRKFADVPQQGENIEDEEYGFTIYENGKILDVSKDDRFKTCESIADIKSWSDCLLSKQRLCRILTDISMITLQ